jgi:hypothetical protein
MSTLDRHGFRTRPIAARLGRTLLNPETVTYQDTDGDDVTVHISKPLFASATINAVLHFDVGATNGTKAAPDNGTKQQLYKLDFTAIGMPSSANGVSISISAKRDRVTGGDGFVNVGYINATGIDLGAVKVAGDLDKIVAGSGIGKKPGLASLRAQTLGVNGLATGAPDLQILIDGKLGALVVKGNVKNAEIDVSGTIGSVIIGGSLLGGSSDFSGEISSTGDMGRVNIGADVAGSTGKFSGSLSSRARLASVSIGGSLIGGSKDFSGAFDSTGNLGPVKIGKDLVGGSGKFSGQFDSSAKLASVTIGGSLVGGSGEFSGAFNSTGDMDPVKIGKDLVGGSGEFSGQFDSSAKLASVTIGGSLVGGTGEFSGEISATGNIGPLKVGKDLVGNVGEFSGMVEGSADLSSATIGGSLVGGSNEDSGAIIATGSLGLVRIGKDIQGGASSFTGYINAKHIAGVTVGGSIISGPNSGNFDHDGWICAEKDLGFVLVKGSIVGNATNLIDISGLSSSNPTPGHDVAIRSVTVIGSVTYTSIRGGYNSTKSLTDANAQIGSVTIDGDWRRSRISAGASAGPDTIPGTTDDTFSGTTSQIGSIVLKGTISGGGSLFAIDSGKIVSLTIDGTKEPLTNGADSLNLAGGSLPVFDMR